MSVKNLVKEPPTPIAMFDFIPINVDSNALPEDTSLPITEGILDEHS